MTMEAAVSQYADRKAEIEQRIGMLEIEKASLQSDIAELKESVSTLEMARTAAGLETEVEALRTEKAVLQEKVATFDEQPSYTIPETSDIIVG